VPEPSYQDLLEVIRELREHIAKQDREIAELKAQIEELRRAGKRQAAPFSKGEPKSDPRPPGRKRGSRYGRQSVRPRPRRVDETIVVQCPLFCGDPACGSRVQLKGKGRQYQIDLPEIRTRVTEFIVNWGRCVDCGKRAQGRHARQVTDALGVGSVHLGPGVISLAGHLNKVGGLSYGKIAALLAEMAGLRVERSTLCRALERLGRKAQPTYESLVRKLRESAVVYPDETGWRVGGRSHWLWAFTNRRETVYAIERGRGFDEAASVLGADFRGVLGADGWAPYRRFENADMQTCLAHRICLPRTVPGCWALPSSST
jgi:transposase